MKCNQRALNNFQWPKLCPDDEQFVVTYAQSDDKQTGYIGELNLKDRELVYLSIRCSYVLL